MNVWGNVSYFMWAARRWPGADRSCPACGSVRTSLLRRKALVTALYRCNACCLMFRVPKECTRESERFYDSQYQQGFTTNCPDDTELMRLIRCNFRDTEKDYATYLNVLTAVGLRPGDVVCDFGCSWGYGSWQLDQAGYRVYSYEICKPRARYAEQRLGCRMLSDLERVPERVDCFFSAHVIEHMPDPTSLWEQVLKVLKPEGVVILFMPNGEPRLAQEDRKRYDRLWGKVHPLVLTTEALSIIAQRFGFHGWAYSSPYWTAEIAASTPGSLYGDELLFVARRSPV